MKASVITIKSIEEASNDPRIFVRRASCLGNLLTRKTTRIKPCIFKLILNKMNKNGAIIIVEDDTDDQEMFVEVFNELNYKNEIVFFNDGQKALAYLISKTTEPFIVFSDINMPKLNGMELRRQIHENEDIRLKTIPYLFFTTSAEQKAVIEAYSKSIQGFFVKPSGYQDLKNIIKIIVEYWQKCESPNYIE